MDSSVFKAILAMDSYNRGPDAKVVIDNVNNLGSAAIGQLSSITLPGSGSTGFFATSYVWNGGAVISYRGIDGLNDVWNGWAAGAGFSSASQAQQAIQYYLHVAQASSLTDPSALPVLLTGHSLGGGLAGFISSLTGNDALLFDHMPFGIAAAAQADPDTPEFWRPEAFHVEGEVLIPVRAGDVQTTLGSVVSILGGGITGYSLTNAGMLTGTLDAMVSNTSLNTYGATLGAVQRHSMALATILVYATNQWGDEGGSGRASDWNAAAKYFLPPLYDNAIGSAVEFDNTTGGASSSDQMAIAIAYSAINEGTRVFGDTGIRAMFDDASDRIWRLRLALARVADLSTNSTDLPSGPQTYGHTVS